MYDNSRWYFSEAELTYNGYNMEIHMGKMDNQNNGIELDKRELRRKRRMRNQIMAYIAIILIIVLCAVLVVFGIGWISDRKDAEALQQEEVVNVMPEEEQLTTPEETVEEPGENTEVEVKPLTSEELLAVLVEDQVESMTLEDKVAGLFIVTPESITGASKAVKAGSGTKDAIAKYPVGGLIYEARNMQNAEQFKEMIKNTQEYCGYPLFIAGTEEGGANSQLAKAKLCQETPSMKKIGSENNSDKAYQMGHTIGENMSTFGMNLNLAPVVDLASEEKAFLKDRTLGEAATQATELLSAIHRGMKENNVTACLKYFPGVGSATKDFHSTIVTIDKSAEEFQADEFVTYKAAIADNAKMIMVTHVNAPALDNSGYCSFSEQVVTNLLRQELGFGGVVLTDRLDVPVITEYFTSEEAAVMALRAGCDMLLAPENFEEAYKGVLKAVADGVISEERINDALRRIYRIKFAERIVE